MIRSIYAAERTRLFRFGISGICSTVFSYLANTLWSFSSTVRRDNLIRFLAVAASGLIETMLLAHGIVALGLAAGWSIVAVVLFVPPVTFVLHRRWTYR